jgi:hypothetical protein
MAHTAFTESTPTASKRCEVGSTDSGKKRWRHSNRHQSKSSINRRDEMADQVTTDPNSVKKAIDVHAAQETAWRVFTEKMGTWWPLA